MSFDNLLNLTCNIQRQSKTQSATTGEMVINYATVYTGIKCRLDEASGGVMFSNNQKLQRATHTLFLHYGKTIKETDKIVIGSSSYIVLLIKNAGGHNHHNELILEIIK